MLLLLNVSLLTRRIAGVSMALSFASLLPKSSDGQSQTETTTIDRKVWYRVCKRSLILFLLGMFLANGYEYSTWRIPGVLQYFAASYFVTSVTVLSVFRFTQRRLQTLSNNISQSSIYDKWEPAVRDTLDESITDTIANFCAGFLGMDRIRIESSKSILLPHILTGYMYEWMIQLALLVLYLAINFGVAAPGCPVGYLGAGGISENSEYRHCTGGIHRYLDMKVTQ
jgi:heparan-alpha-glucosaminide N-acetyltransferase